MSQVTILFVSNTDPREGRRTFQAGEVVEMSAASARHWVSRKRAELVEGNMSVKPTLKSGETRAEAVAEMAEQIGELANAEMDSAANVGGQDGGDSGHGAEPDAAASDAGEGGEVAAPRSTGGRRRK